MISFTRRTRVFVSKEPTDMRASYDTLFSKAKGVLNQDPLFGPPFCFYKFQENLDQMSLLRRHWARATVQTP
jgi:hypothetical protein